MNAFVPNLKEYPPRNGKIVSLSLLHYTCFTRLELINYLPLNIEETQTHSSSSEGWFLELLHTVVGYEDL